MESAAEGNGEWDLGSDPAETVAPLSGEIGPELKMLALGSRLLGPVAPGLAARLAYRLWFRTVRPPDPPRALPVLRAAERSMLEVDDLSVATYAWGKGPIVLLVHGWSSHTGHMAGFVEPLLERGFGVVAFDGPAHGRSPGERTDIFELRRALLAVAGAGGPVRGVVAHSLGSLAFLDAQASALDADACVLISPGVHLDALVGAFTGQVGLSDRTAAELQRRVAAFVGEGYYDGLWDGTRSPTLILHDRDDEEIPCREGRRVASRLDDARFQTTEGLGHRRILQDGGVQEEAAEFLSTASSTLVDGGG